MVKARHTTSTYAIAAPNAKIAHARIVHKISLPIAVSLKGLFVMVSPQWLGSMQDFLKW